MEAIELVDPCQRETDASARRQLGSVQEPASDKRKNKVETSDDRVSEAAGKRSTLDWVSALTMIRIEPLEGSILIARELGSAFRRVVCAAQRDVAVDEFIFQYRANGR